MPKTINAEALAKAYFEYVDGVLEMEGGWAEISQDAREFFTKRMEWALKKVQG